MGNYVPILLQILKWNASCAWDPVPEEDGMRRRCKVIKTVATQTNVLRVIDCRNVMVVGCCEPHHHIHGLLSRCVRAGNLSAEYMLAKVVLGGGPPFWKMILENDLTNSSIKCATALPSSERHYIAESLNSGSIADLPYILFSLENLPHLHESYGRLHHLILIRSFILLADLREFVPICHVLKDFMEFFVGYHRSSESGIHDSVVRMCECISRTDGRLSDALLETFWYLRLPFGSPSFRGRAILALDNLLRQGPLSY